MKASSAVFTISKHWGLIQLYLVPVHSSTQLRHYCSPTLAVVVFVPSGDLGTNSKCTCAHLYIHRCGGLKMKVWSATLLPYYYLAATERVCTIDQVIWNLFMCAVISLQPQLLGHLSSKTKTHSYTWQHRGNSPGETELLASEIKIFFRQLWFIKRTAAVNKFTVWPWGMCRKHIQHSVTLDLVRASRHIRRFKQSVKWSFRASVLCMGLF